jgi:hypothetical protein
MALGKKVHSYFDMDELKRQIPIQNGGKLVDNIVRVCRNFLAFKCKKEDFMKNCEYESTMSKLVCE